MTWRDRIAGKVVVASVSGGKDSAALSLWLTEQGIEHRRVFADTGWEADETYAYLRGPLAKAIGPIDEVRGDLLMPDLVRKKGMFPSRTRRFCTQELKVKPILRYLSRLCDEGHDPINAVGVRAAESEARAKLGEWEWQESYDTWLWRPLITWSEQDVIDIHHRHGLVPNPLYLRGASRVGCWPCIHARKSEIRHIADVDPGRIDEIRRLEADVAAAAQARHAAKGETFESLGYNRPAFFQAPGALRSEGADGRCVPIDDVVAWSKTSRGGRQVELFSAPNEGCVRWGLCEQAADELPADGVPAAPAQQEGEP